ncbi:MAG: hypothetical protein ACK4UJ_05480 [Leptonema sp. (in: bacteria)]
MSIIKKEKEEFKKKLTKYKEKLQELEKEEKIISALGKKEKDIQEYVKIKECILKIQKASINCDIAVLSQMLQNIRGDAFIADARKEVYGIITDFLKISKIDHYSTLTDNQEFLQKISEMNPTQRYNLMKALHLILNKIYDLELQGKYRWSLPEIYQKFALLIFSFLDFKLLEKTKNPDMEYYDSLHNHLDLLIEILQKAAQEYRSKYELASKDLESLQNVKKNQELLKRIYNFTGDKQEEAKITLALDATKAKIDSILEKEKKESKKK